MYVIKEMMIPALTFSFANAHVGAIALAILTCFSLVVANKAIELYLGIQEEPKVS
jgi:hypothetical protein